MRPPSSLIRIFYISVLSAVFAIAAPAFAKPAKKKMAAPPNTLKAAGKVELSQNKECIKQAVCYVITGDVNIAPFGKAKLTGEGTINPGTCRPNQTDGMCCKDLLFAIAQTSADTSIDFTMSGQDCTKSETQEILKASVKITGGTGKFKGASGSGTATMTIDPALGNGTISIAAKLK
jgi:hypothetical protein